MSKPNTDTTTEEVQDHIQMVEDAEDTEDDIPLSELKMENPIEIHNRLHPQFMGLPLTEKYFILHYIQPFLLYCMLGTLRNWAQQTASKHFLHTHWFQRWGFRKVFLHAFDTAYSRLPYRRVQCSGDQLTTMTTLTAEPYAYQGLPLSFFWNVNLVDQGTGFCGGIVDIANPSYTYFSTLFPELISSLFDQIKAQTPSWGWKQAKKRKVNIKVTLPTSTVNGNIWTLDFNTITLVDKLRDKESKVRKVRVDLKHNLTLLGMHYYKDFPAHPVTSCPLDGKPTTSTATILLQTLTASLAIHEGKDETVSKLTVLVSFLKDQYRNQQQQLALISAKLTFLDLKLSTAESNLILLDTRLADIDSKLTSRLDNIERVIAPRLSRETLSSPNSRPVELGIFEQLSPI